MEAPIHAERGPYKATTENTIAVDLPFDNEKAECHKQSYHTNMPVRTVNGRRKLQTRAIFQFRVRKKRQSRDSLEIVCKSNGKSRLVRLLLLILTLCLVFIMCESYLVIFTDLNHTKRIIFCYFFFATVLFIYSTVRKMVPALQ